MTVPDVLLVDDDADIRDSLKLALELEGYDVSTARDGSDAWALLDAGLRPALVLLDLAMPGLSGPEVLARVRADARIARLPVVILTAFRTIAASVQEAADGCLFKPVDLDTLLSNVARHCPRNAASAG